MGEAQNSPASDVDAEHLIQEQLDLLKKDFSLEKYISTFGPLHWSQWVRSLHRDPQRQAGLRSIIEEAEAHQSHLNAERLKGLVSFIDSTPDLNRRVRMEYGIQLAHLLRSVLFTGSIEEPGKKSLEWKALYQRLKEILKRRGKLDAFGEGDYLLVDDEVEEPGHKIEIKTPDVLTPELLEEIQGALGAWKNTWYVILQLDFDRVNPDALPAMLTVWSDHVDEAWDKEQLKSVLGPRFKL